MTGVFDLVNSVLISGESVLTAANGDQLFGYVLPPAGSPAIITGGTGRFEGATGSSVLVETWDEETTVDLESMTMTTSYSARLEGTLTY